MKKLLVILLALSLVLALAACGEADKNPDGTNPPETDGSDKTNPPEENPGDTTAPENPPEGGDEPAGGLEGYPADLNDWSGEDFVRYFTEAGVFEKEEFVILMGPDIWAGTAINDYVQYADDTGLISITICTFDPENTMVDVPAFLDFVRENHTFDDSLYFQPVDHMVGNVTFAYEKTLDEPVYEAMDAAYKTLIEAMGVTPDF